MKTWKVIDRDSQGRYTTQVKASKYTWNGDRLRFFREEATALSMVGGPPALELVLVAEFNSPDAVILEPSDG